MLDKFKLLNELERDFYEERAAILEFDANMYRLDAQKKALELTEKTYNINFTQRFLEKNMQK